MHMSAHAYVYIYLYKYICVHVVRNLSKFFIWMRFGYPLASGCFWIILDNQLIAGHIWIWMDIHLYLDITG